MEFSNENKAQRKRGGFFAKLVRVEVFVILLLSALLLAALSIWLATSNTVGGQSKFVDNSKYQAVFLNIGQVYFGKITTINDKFMVLDDVFYVNCNTGTNGTGTCQQNGNNTYTLYKLGVNELHKPQDRMVVNQAQVAYWENLQDNGKVVQAINQYKKNPNAANNSQVQQNTNTPSSSTSGQ